MPVVERALIVALCGIALIVLVAWIVTSLRRDRALPPIEAPPARRSAPDQLSPAYAKDGWVEAHDESGEIAPPGIRNRPPHP